MGALNAVEFVTLDGVMQGFHGTDDRDGFRHSGWGTAYADAAQSNAGAADVSATAAYLFGRRTYDEMVQFWPDQPDDNPMADHCKNSTSPTFPIAIARSPSPMSRPGMFRWLSPKRVRHSR